MADKISYTRGPWLLDNMTVYALDETGSCNRFSAQVQWGFKHHSQGDKIDERTSEDELTANARLIAAAPELLEALETTLANAKLFNRDTDLMWVAVRDKAETAIAKARGEA